MQIIKMKKVLIALDYDPTAQKVAETGFSLAKSMGAEVTLLHVLADPLDYTTLGHITIMGFANHDDMNALEVDTNEGLKKAAQYFLDNTKHHLGDKNVQTLIKEGDSAESILEAAKKMNADLIVMGSHSRKWFENIVMGSVTEKVLNNSSYPMFIVPTKQKKEK
ncbi:MAG TPA: universal stress protein [Bacteroidales bacterium]|jgi:nucleotide-binding universal stress UspA family protein|nr:universal stress protein [Bacteroidales bacterium]